MSTSTFIDVADAVTGYSYDKGPIEYQLRTLSPKRRIEVSIFWKGLKLGDPLELELKLVTLFWVMFEYVKTGKVNPWKFQFGTAVFRPKLSWSMSGAVLSSHYVVVPSAADLTRLPRRHLVQTIGPCTQEDEMALPKGHREVE